MKPMIVCLAAACLITAVPAFPEPGRNAAAAQVPSQTLIDALTAWLVAEQGLPMPPSRPQVVFASVSEIAALRDPGLRLDRQAERRPAGGRGTVSVYDPATRTIVLPTGWTGRTPVELSVLVHELVHHLQTSAGMRFGCVAESEEAAYAAQERWLVLFGRSLERDFAVDPFTRMVSGLCN